MSNLIITARLLITYFRPPPLLFKGVIVCIECESVYTSFA